MAIIDEYLSNIQSATYGEEVRQSIHDAIEAINDEAGTLAQERVDLAVESALSEVDAELGNLKSDLNEKINLPEVDEIVDFTVVSGWIDRRDLSIYSGYSNAIYTSIPVTAGEKYLISGYSQNNNYPCAFGVIDEGTSGYIPLFLSGYDIVYTDSPVTIPEGVITLYVNGEVSNPINIKKVVHMTQEEASNNIVNALNKNTRIKATYDGTNLLFKKKYNDSFDVVIRMKNTGGNNLFTFDNMYAVDNTNDRLNDNFTPSSSMPSWPMNQTDWFGPYRVKAVSNGNGDHPTDKYFTGGNHRSNNTASGGGITASQVSLIIKFDDIVPVNNQVYDVECIDLQWTNMVQGYNTSKDDGTGRAILSETWSVHITADAVEVYNDIVALENIVIETYYGIQAFTPGWNCVFIGGEDRTSDNVGANRESGNKTCRSIIASNDYFSVKMTIDAVDLGLFENSSFSCSTFGNKLYGSLVEGTTLEVSKDEHYYLSGSYKFNS